MNSEQCADDNLILRGSEFKYNYEITQFCQNIKL